MNKKIIPNLWLKTQAEEAVDFYTSVFNQSSIVKSSIYSRAGEDVHHKKPGDVITLEFELLNFKFVALNVGPHFKFNPSISFFVLYCSEKDIENAWERLVEEWDILLPLNSHEWSKKYGWFRIDLGLTGKMLINKEKRTCFNSMHN